jgi:hypothetical protein
MGLVEIVVVIYVTGLAYSVVHDGASPIVAATWPLGSAIKICVWIAKRDPSLTSLMGNWESRIAALESQIAAQQQPPTPGPAPPSSSGGS